MILLSAQPWLLEKVVNVSSGIWVEANNEGTKTSILEHLTYLMTHVMIDNRSVKIFKKAVEGNTTHNSDNNTRASAYANNNTTNNTTTANNNTTTDGPSDEEIKNIIENFVQHLIPTGI